MRTNKIYFAVLFFILFASACRGKIIKNKENETAIELVQSDKVEVIQLKLNDSTYVRINIDSGINLRSIVWHNKGVTDGESLVFYPNGKLEKRVGSKDAIRNGHTQYFYESGALKSDLFYCSGKPSYYGVEHWITITVYLNMYIYMEIRVRLRKLEILILLAITFMTAYLLQTLNILIQLAQIIELICVLQITNSKAWQMPGFAVLRSHVECRGQRRICFVQTIHCCVHKQCMSEDKQHTSEDKQCMSEGKQHMSEGKQCISEDKKDMSVGKQRTKEQQI